MIEIKNETTITVYTNFDGDKVQIGIPPHDKPIIIEVPKECAGVMTIREEEATDGTNNEIH